MEADDLLGSPRDPPRRRGGRWLVSIDTRVGVASGGDTRKEALEILDEAVALPTGEAGEPIEDEGAFLREIGIDPEEIPDAPEPLPDFMK